MTPDQDQDDAPIRVYLISAGIPAGLLLWAGSKYILKRVGDNEIYRKEAAGTLTALEWLQHLGLACALICSLVFLWSLKKIIWRRQ